MHFQGNSMLKPVRRPALFLLFALIALGVWFGPPWVSRSFFAGSFDFTDLEEPAGFRHLAGGDVSGGLDPVMGLLGAGIEEAGEAGPAAGIGGMDLCHALFDDETTGSAGPVVENSADYILPIAYFSDYRCPYCRILSKRLEALENARADIRVRWHEW